MPKKPPSRTEEASDNGSPRPLSWFHRLLVIAFLGLAVVVLSLISMEASPRYTRKQMVASTTRKRQWNLPNVNISSMLYQRYVQISSSSPDVSSSSLQEEQSSLTGTKQTQSDVTTNATTTTHWCVIDRDKIPVHAAYFDHFPHCLEVVLPCWSWFRKTHSTKTCGFVLVGDLLFDRQGNHTWQNQLIRTHMKCQVRNVPSEESLDRKDGGVYHSPNLKFMRPRYGHRNYLYDPEDAQALRRAVGVSDEWVATQKGNDRPLQIGLLQRKQTRRVKNMDDIARGLQEALPDANVTQTSFDHAPSVLDQARWFASKDVIVAAHGAALTNSVFLTRGTIVVQLFPPYFYWQFYDPLIEQSGGLALGWTYGKDPLSDFVALKTNWKIKNRQQHASFSVPVEHVVEIVLVALDRQLPSAEMIQDSTFRTR